MEPQRDFYSFFDSFFIHERLRQATAGFPKLLNSMSKVIFQVMADLSRVNHKVNSQAGKLIGRIHLFLLDREKKKNTKNSLFHTPSFTAYKYIFLKPQRQTERQSAIKAGLISDPRSVTAKTVRKARIISRLSASLTYSHILIKIKGKCSTVWQRFSLGEELNDLRNGSIRHSRSVMAVRGNRALKCSN